MDCQGALAAAIVVAGAFYIVNGKLGGKIYSTTNYIKNRYGQKLSAYESELVHNVSTYFVKVIDD